MPASASYAEGSKSAVKRSSVDRLEVNRLAAKKTREKRKEEMIRVSVEMARSTRSAIKSLASELLTEKRSI